ncbi:pentatricopeptide repeat-containing protein At3g26782, mitochondrial-like [Phalaenopsis equestris]|uniref:pentatricopeptide repeat-containing protein At3g26782, mitochondrial-like n=1 Tax=Phalaenopsis equestris TaxID=78828 RepID=UPI0009E21477|nr:pentatricopeptide repeat-containing protein At3g26782, mitochondrial-like [Phalaenopsis equestris]
MLGISLTFRPKHLPTFNSLFLYTTSSLSSIIRYHLDLRKPKEALPLVLKWQKQAVTPDKFTIPSLLKLSSALGEPLLNGEQFHGFALKSGHIHDLFVSTGLVELYFRNGQLKSPRQLFDEMPENDVVLFTAMISGFAQNRVGHQALEFFSAMLEEGKIPNRITFSAALSASSQLKQISLGKVLHGYSLRSGMMDKADVILQTSFLDMYAKAGNICYTRRIFDEMDDRNMVSWNIIMDAYFSAGAFEEAIDLFQKMVIACPQYPRSTMLNLVLQICGISTDLRKGKEVHGYVLKCSSEMFGAESLLECNSIVDMYMKTGNLESAILVFERMSERNVVTWTTMISGCGIHGLSRKALEAFDEMKESGVLPDGITFIAILSACSHGGLVDEGRKLFHSMKSYYNIIPEMKHYVCMVDLYGRAGNLNEAFDFVREMPLEPSKLIWGSLLSSCKKHKNLGLGELAFKRAIFFDKFDVGNYMLLCRIYADADRWEDFARVRLLMKEIGVKASVAFSWVEIRGRVYRFTVNDCSNPISGKIYHFLQNLVVLMEKYGFASEPSNVAHNYTEEQKVRDLCGHTEKLALAFSLMCFGDKKIVRIGKNLRVCGDCHEVFKFVSRIFEREIVLKDLNRYHKFKQGCCSCNDFW